MCWENCKERCFISLSFFFCSEKKRIYDVHTYLCKFVATSTRVPVLDAVLDQISKGDALSGVEMRYLIDVDFQLAFSFKKNV